MAVSLEKKPSEDPRVVRFKRMAQLIGGCLVDANGVITERPGWVTYAGHYLGTDGSNLTKIMNSQRPLTAEMEAKLMTDAVQNFRDNEKNRLKQILLVQTDYTIDRQGAFLAQFTQDGPEPQIGG